MPTKAKTKTKRAKPTLAQVIFQDVCDAIKQGRLSIGDKLPTESGIMEKYSVSRTVVREAILKLQAAGLVETRHGIGTFVVSKPNESNALIEISAKDTLPELLDLLEFRMGFEVEACGLAAKRRDYDHIKKLEQALHALQKRDKTNTDPYTADFQFHYLIAEATGNKHYTELMNLLGSKLIPHTRLNTNRIHHEHEDIFAAIARGDSQAARAAMRLHLINSREALREVLSRANL